MVWLEIEKKGIKMIMVDGFVPNFKYLKEYISALKFRKTRRDYPDGVIKYWDGFYNYLRKETISEHQLVRLFSNTVDVLARGFCPGEKFMPCNRYSIGTGKLVHGIGRGQLMQLKREMPKAYVALIEEYKHDKDRKKEGYLQRLVISKTEGEYICGNLEKLCCYNWIDKLKFRVKNELEYKDFDVFKNAWTKFMNLLYDRQYKT